MKKKVEIPIVISAVAGGTFLLYELVTQLYAKYVANNPNHTTNQMNNALNLLINPTQKQTEDLTPASNLLPSLSSAINPDEPAPSLSNIKTVQNQIAANSPTGTSGWWSPDRLAMNL